MQETVDFIPDNYEFPAYIAPLPGLHGGHRITYRPMANADISAMYGKTKGKGDEDANKIVADTIAPRIKSWSVKGPNGEAVDITPKNFLKLNVILANKISEVVQGYRPSDVDPEGVIEPKSGTMHLEETAKN